MALTWAGAQTPAPRPPNPPGANPAVLPADAPSRPARGGRNPDPASADDPQLNPSAHQRQELQAEFQKKLTQQAAQLVTLSRALQTTIDKNDPNVLSLDVIHQADEVEKLARKISDEMKSGLP